MAKTVASKELTEVSEAQIAVHWKEEEHYQPSEKFKAQANMRDTHILEKFGLAKFSRMCVSRMFACALNFSEG